MQSAYMQFAKLGAAARFSLASSGVANASLAELQAEPDDFVLHGENSYGFAPLTGRIAARFGVPEDCVVTAAGTSFANHLAIAAMIAPGDEVLIETPTYELLEAMLGYAQARLTRFARSAEAGWALDPQTVADQITPRTRLVVLTNLHNPSSALAPAAAIASIAAAAARVGAMVLVDEVYLELLFTAGAAWTAFRPDGNIVVTSSLTKAYGLSGLRSGWCLAPAALATRMRLLNDLFASVPVHLAETLSVRAFDRLDFFRARGNALLAANRAAYREILGGHQRLEQSIFDHGTTVFPRLLGTDGDILFETLMARFETSLVPGRFFGAPAHVRIGLGGDPATTRAGLECVAAALDELP